jgi:hypothetical protein
MMDRSGMFARGLQLGRLGSIEVAMLFAELALLASGVGLIVAAVGCRRRCPWTPGLLYASAAVLGFANVTQWILRILPTLTRGRARGVVLHVLLPDDHCGCRRARADPSRTANVGGD